MFDEFGNPVAPRAGTALSTQSDGFRVHRSSDVWVLGSPCGSRDRPAPPSSARRRTPGSRPRGADYLVPSRHDRGARPGRPGRGCQDDPVPTVEPGDLFRDRSEPGRPPTRRPRGGPAETGPIRAVSPAGRRAVAAPPAPGTGPARRVGAPPGSPGRRRRARHADHPTDPAGLVDPAHGHGARAHPGRAGRAPGADVHRGAAGAVRAGHAGRGGAAVAHRRAAARPRRARSSRCAPRWWPPGRPTCSPGDGDGDGVRRRGGADGRRAAYPAGTWCRSCRWSRGRRGSRSATGWCSAGPGATRAIRGRTRSWTSSGGRRCSGWRWPSPSRCWCSAAGAGWPRWPRSG